MEYGYFERRIKSKDAEIARLQADVDRLNKNVKYHMGLVGGLMQQRDTAWNDALEAAAQCTGNLVIRGAIRALRKEA